MSSVTATASADDALAKAKLVAARLSAGQSHDNDSSNAAVPSPSSATASETSRPSGSKRKRWGVAAPAPTQAPTASEVLPGLSKVAKKMKETKETKSKRMWVTTTDERTEYHYFVYLPQRLDKLQQDIGKNADGDTVKITLKGRGASGTAPLPGVPEEPMNVLVEGPPDLFLRAEMDVEALLNEAEKAPLAAQGPLPPPPGTEPVETDNPSSALTLQSSYRPASVAQLIANSGNPLASLASANNIEEKLYVPNGVVGFIIGRGGENIASLQRRTGCKVQIQKEHEIPHGQTQRIITLSAPTQDAVDECRELVMDMVKDRVRASGGPSNNTQSNKVLDAMASGHALIKFDVPDSDVGLVIGKAGSTIKGIQEATGASIQIPPNSNSDSPTIRTISITHPTEAGAQEARKQIETILQNRPTAVGGHTNKPAENTVQIPIPDKDVGLCIGRQGCVIKELQRKSNTRIQIPSKPLPGEFHRVATVAGSVEGIEIAKGMIDRIIREQSSAFVLSGTGHPLPGGQPRMNSHQHHQYRPPPQQLQQQPVFPSQPHPTQYYNQPPGNLGGQAYGSGPGMRPGGPGSQYHRFQHSRQWPPQRHPPQHSQQPSQQTMQTSPEWQAYYAAQTVAGEKQKQEQQQQAASQAQAPSQTPNDYQEQFFRYAYYYGEDAARKYYGAWSPPVGTPNPYGVNPNGISAPPTNTAQPGVAAQSTAQAPASPAAPAAAPTAASATSSARDSSVRKVSNLPAWMTKGKS